MLLAAALGVGLLARTDGLGSRPVSLDEYYFASSVERIVETGSVRFPTGGYYTRGLLPQYLTATSWWLLGSDGFGFRLPVLLFSLASVLAAFLYARIWVTPALASVVAAALLVSSWQVEMGRFLRMYAPFQLATLLLLIAVHRAYVDGRWQLRYLPHVAIIVAALSHELTIFLCPLLFLPFALPVGGRPLASRRPAAVFASVSALTTLSVVIWSLGPFHHLGVSGQYPAGYRPEIPPVIRLSAEPLWSLGMGDRVDVALLLAVNLVVLLGFAARGALAREEGRRTCLLSLLLVSALLHQFALAVLLSLVLVGRHGVGLIRRPTRVSAALLLVSVLAILGWSLVALGVRPGSQVVEGWVPVRRLFFGFPDLSTAAWLWWRYLPHLATILAGALVIVLFKRRRAPLAELIGHPAMLVVFLLLCFGIAQARVPSLRYYFFIYPLLLIVLAIAITDIVPGQSLGSGSLRARLSAVAPVVFLALFVASEDFEPAHLRDVPGAEATFCVDKFARLRSPQGPWFCRDDVASPSRWLNERVAAEPVIVASEPTASFYLTRDHAHYLRRRSTLFDAHSRSGGTVDLWSGRPLLSTPEEAQTYVGQAGAAWLVRAVRERRAFPERFLFPRHVVRSERLFSGRDGRIEVLHLHLEPRSSTSR